MSRAIVVAGGTGLLGQALRPRLEALGHPVVLISRGPDGRPWEALPELVEGAAAVVNLAGENLAEGRWSEARQARLLDSRVASARRIAEAIRAAATPPPVLIQASAVGWYGACGPDSVDEASPQGTGFLADVCARWEAEAFRAPTRVVALRLGVILAREGGALPRMALPIRAFAGAGLGPQGLSWIHIQDAVGMIVAALQDARWQGPVNACAPDPRSSDRFSQVLAKTLRRPLWPIPRVLTGPLLRLAFGEMAQRMLLEGAFVQPTRALALGYRFQHPELEEALADLLGER